MSQHQVNVIWCDDVRQEVSGKYSLIGVYQSKLIPSELPISLSKLCVIVQVRSSVDGLPTSLTVHIRKNVGDLGNSDNEEVLREMSLSEEELANASDGLSAAGELDENDDTVDRSQMIQFVATFSPLQFEAPCLLRVVVTIDGEEIPGNALQVTEPPSASE